MKTRQFFFLGLMLMVSMAANAQEVIFKRLDHYYDNCWTFQRNWWFVDILLFLGIIQKKKSDFNIYM